MFQVHLLSVWNRLEIVIYMHFVLMETLTASADKLCVFVCFVFNINFNWCN